MFVKLKFYHHHLIKQLLAQTSHKTLDGAFTVIPGRRPTQHLAGICPENVPVMMINLIFKASLNVASVLTSTPAAVRQRQCFVFAARPLQLAAGLVAPPV